MEDRSVPALDDATVDRLLAGAIAPADAPGGYQDVARALHAAALSATDAPTGHGTTAVAAFLDAIPTRRTARMKKWKIAAATLAGGLTLSTGLAAADVLPGAAQDVASDALAKVGISVPSKHNDKADTRGKSAEHKKAKDAKVTEEETPPSTPKPDNHGSVVSKVAGDKTTEGADHGSAVCATASDGKCQPNGSKPAAPSTKAGQGSANSTAGSANSTDGGQTSTESETTSSSGSTSGSSSSSSGGSSSSSGGGSSGSASNGSGTGG